MELYKELNIFEDKKLYIAINVFSLVVFAVTAVLVIAGNILLLSNLEVTFTFSIVIWTVVLVALSLPVHELIHGIFFRVFAPSNSHSKVKYGFKQGMYYATNPGVIYKKGAFSVIILAPFIFNSILFLLLYLVGLDGQIVAYAFIIHTGGCAGDFWYMYELLKNPSITHCEDTPTGVKFFVSK